MDTALLTVVSVITVYLLSAFYLLRFSLYFWMQGSFSPSSLRYVVILHMISSFIIMMEVIKMVSHTFLYNLYTITFVIYYMSFSLLITLWTYHINRQWQMTQFKKYTEIIITTLLVYIFVIVAWVSTQWCDSIPYWHS